MKRSGLAASLAERAIGEGLPLAFLVLWWLTARSLPSFILPGPIETGETLLQLFIDPAFVGEGQARKRAHLTRTSQRQRKNAVGRVRGRVGRMAAEHA